MIRAMFQSTWWPEFWSGVMAVGWALTFAISGEPLGISSPNSFLALERIEPGNIWAWYCLAIGVAQFFVLILDCRPARWVCAILMSWFPCTAVVSMLLSDHLTPHIAVYGGWAGINIFTAVRPLRLLR